MEKIYIRCGYTDMRKQLNGLLISSSTTSNWILTAIPYSCSVGKRADRIKAVHYEETVSAFYTNGTKTDVSNGRGPAKKQNRFLISSCAGFWKVLNPEQPKAVQKWLPHKSENTENP